MMNLSLIKRLRYVVLIAMTCMVTGAIFAQVQIGSGINYAAPKPYKVAGITVTGATINDVQAIRMFAGIREGDEVMIPGDRISKAIRNLWDQHLFSEVEVYAAEFRGSEVYLVINVKELPHLGAWPIDGDISRGEANSVREKLLDYLRSGQVVNENLKNTCVNIIRAHFSEKGYYGVEVNITESPDKVMENAVALHIIITKGQRMKVESIAFAGNEALPDKRLKRTLKNTKEQRWYRVFKASRYIEKEFDEDKDKLIAVYNKEGFRNAKIIADSLSEISANRLKIDISLNEGKKFYFRNITFTGNIKYRTGQLDSILNIKKGEVYNLELLENRLYFNPSGRDITALYQDDGYLSFQVYPFETLVGEDSIDVQIRMSEGKQYRIGRVIVTGNTKTNDHVIYREVRTRPGDLFNRSEIMRTQRELAALGYFNPEAFNVIPTQHPESGTVDLEYIVEEKPSDQVELSGGWGGGRVVGSLGLSFNNFSLRNIFNGASYNPLPAGDGQRLSIRAVTNGLFYQSYQLSFTEPWLGGRKPNSLSVSAYHSVQTNGQRKYEDGERNPDRQSLFITGGTVSFGKRLQKPDDYFNVFAGLSYQHFELDKFGSFFSFTDGLSNNLALTGTIERNSTSDPIFPTSGSQINFSTKLTLPYRSIGEAFGNSYDYSAMTDQERYRWVEYHKWKFTAKWYTKLNNHKTHNFVLATSAGFGLLGTYKPQLGEAPFERFYLGGVFLSGFLLDGREIVNLRGYDDLSLTSPSDRIGSPAIAKYGFELRYPLSTNPNAYIYTLAFLEAGKTWTNVREFNPFNVYRSAGMGLRIFLPMFGMLGFDYGWRLDDVESNPNMSKGQFHFSIGMNMGEL
ncbi:MAG: outer membrane protein assembly factor BamA [Flavobacteriales bacterium]|nr:outer membrane protein assembly factor BamA [Flavobacteriales bacterium]